LGRFIQRDPIGYDAEDVSLYRYVKSNPLLFLDSWGKKSCNCEQEACQIEHNSRLQRLNQEVSDCAVGTMGWLGVFIAVTCVAAGVSVGMVATPAGGAVAGLICTGTGIIIELSLASPCTRAYNLGREIDARLTELCYLRLTKPPCM
jgi:hypothetical protein